MGSKKTKTEAINPAWSTNLVSGLAGQVGNLTGADPQSFVAGSNKYLDTAGSSLMAGLDPNVQKYLDAGAGGGGSVGYHAASDYMGNYQNPYIDQVLKTTLADFDANAGKTRAQQDLNFGGAGAFGGSGGYLGKALTEGELSRARATTDAGIRSDAFNTAAGLGQGDASQATQADSTNAQLAESKAGRALQAAGLLSNINSQNNNSLLNLGQLQYGMDQAKAQAPLSLLQTQAGLAGALPLNLFSGQKTTQSGGTLGAIGSGLLGAASLFAAPMTGGLSLGGLGSLFGGASALAGAGNAMKRFY